MSKFVAHADGGIDVSGVDVAAGHTFAHPAVHGADVSVEVHVESVVGVEGKGLETSAASAVCGCRAARLSSGAVGILMSTVIGRGQLEVGNDGVANAGPKDLHNLRIVVSILSVSIN